MNLKINKFFIIAGESSGDLHGASLMESMLNQNTNIMFIGIGGKKMEKMGLNSLFPIEKLAVMGFFKVIKNLFFFIKVKNRIINIIRNDKPDQIILIDYPGLNLYIAKKLKKKFRIPITYYISPQIWAWKGKRLKNIKSYIDQMIVFFPFEKIWYAKRNVLVECVGYPYKKLNIEKSILKKNMGINPDYPLLTIFPGSRQQELDYHLKTCLNATKIIKNKIPNLQIIIGLSNSMDYNELPINQHIKIEKENSLRALQAADFAIIASGTATLQATIFRIPHIIIYKTDSIFYLFARFMIKTKFIGLPNIIANKMIVPELIQSKMNSKNIVNYMFKMVSDSSWKNKMKDELNKVCASLGDGNASTKAAKKIINFISYEKV